MSLEVSVLGQRINISRADDADGADANPALCSGSRQWTLTSIILPIILRRMTTAGRSQY
jgi:hypothetical protein